MIIDNISLKYLIRGVKKKDEFINSKRILMTFAGIFLAGVSVAIFKASDFGTDPNSCFVMGVWNLAGIKYSYVYIAINALMLLGVFFLDRHFIGLGTVLNLFLWELSWKRNAAF